MKTNPLIHCQLPALAAGLFLTLPHSASAAPASAAVVEEAAPSTETRSSKEVIKEEITATGTVFSVEPEILSVVMKDNPTPVRFSYNKETPFLDEKGAKVPLDLVRAELPLTVHYRMDGEKMVASRVVMSRSMVAGDATEKPDKKRLELAEEKAEEKADENTRAVQAERNGPREFMGTVSTIEQTISVVPRGETVPTSCIINSSTRFVNSSGQPVSTQLLMPGVPVSVKTVRDGKRVIAQVIIVRGDSPSPSAGGTTPQGGTVGGQNSGGTGTSTGSSNGYPGLIPGQGNIIPGQINPVIPGQINPAAGVPGSPAQPGNPNQPGTPPAPGQPTNPNNPTQPSGPANPAQPGTAQPNVPPAGGNTPPAGGNTPRAGGNTPPAGGSSAPPRAPSRSGSSSGNGNGNSQPPQTGSGNR